MCFFSEHVQKLTCTISTAAAMVGVLKMWVNYIESDDEKITIKTPSVVRSLEIQNGVHKNTKIVECNHMDVHDEFYQCIFSTNSEEKLNEVIFNYHEQNITFKNAMLFASHFKLIQSIYMLDKTLQMLHHENVIIYFERGPCALFPKSDSISTFWHDYVEPEKLFLIPPFGTKKRTSVK